MVATESRAGDEGDGRVRSETGDEVFQEVQREETQFGEGGIQEGEGVECQNAMFWPVQK